MASNKEKLKAFADFSQTGFYQGYLKPYLNEILNAELASLDLDPKTEFDSIKRDINLMAVKKTLRRIITMVDTANDEYSKILITNRNKYE